MNGRRTFAAAAIGANDDAMAAGTSAIRFCCFSNK
jgi:hypothetical protein